jgi:protein-disulfide isomerase
MVYCIRTSMNTNKDSSKRIKKINNDTKLILIVVLVFLSGIQGVILISSSSSSSSSSSYLGGQVFALQEHINNKEKDENNNDLSLSSLIKQGSPHLGDLSAPITIIDFSDFQCYLCARYVKETEPIIYETYIQTGKVNLVFKHLPNRGSDSMGAAIAAQCTNDQGKFWEYHKILYTNQKPIDSGWVSKDNLKKFASKTTGLNMSNFNSCLDSEKYKSLVEKDLAFGSSFGFQDTPSFIIVNNDGSKPEILRGAHPFPSFKALIDKKIVQK